MLQMRTAPPHSRIFANESERLAERIVEGRLAMCGYRLVAITSEKALDRLVTLAETQGLEFG